MKTVGEVVQRLNEDLAKLGAVYAELKKIESEIKNASNAVERHLGFVENDKVDLSKFTSEEVNKYIAEQTPKAEEAKDDKVADASPASEVQA